MTEVKDWIKELKYQNPELNTFITKLEGFISDTGFNASQFDKAVAKGLSIKEEEAQQKLNSDAEN